MAITDVEEYSVAADAWVQRAPLATPISHFAAAYLDAQIIAFGGQDACTTVALCSNGCVSKLIGTDSAGHQGLKITHVLGT